MVLRFNSLTRTVLVKCKFLHFSYESSVRHVFDLNRMSDTKQFGMESPERRGVVRGPTREEYPNLRRPGYG